MLTLAGAPAAGVLASAPPAAPGTASAAEEHRHAPGTAGSGALPLVVAFLALALAIGGVILGARANRRTVSS